MARNDFGLAILEAETMQKRDQSRAAFVRDTELRCDPSADVTGRARRRRSYPSNELGLLLVVQRAGAAAGRETHERLAAAFGKRAMPPTDRIVVEKQHLGDLLTAHSAVEQNQSIGPPSQAIRHRTITRQRNQRRAFPRRQKARPNHAANPNPMPSNWQVLFAFSMSRGIAGRTAGPTEIRRPTVEHRNRYVIQRVRVTSLRFSLAARSPGSAGGAPSLVEGVAQRRTAV